MSSYLCNCLGIMLFVVAALQVLAKKNIRRKKR